MGVKITSYGGILGFYLRKYIPKVCSNAYLFLQRKFSDFPNRKYMNSISNKIIPLFVNIETISKCNGLCSFCCCNAKDDERKTKIMSGKTFHKIIDDLSVINYDGVITLNINNEPFLDKDLINKLKYVRSKIPKAYSYLYTNGSLLNIKKMQEIIEYNLLDELVVNNYSTKYKLNHANDKLYKYLKDKNLNFKVSINLRYSHEVLSNRANTSPNKRGAKLINSLCSIPYTDLNIFPDGIVGICCCDTKEVSNLGNVNDSNIIDIFNNEKLKDIRKKMLNGRNANEFCKYCDFNDIGTRRKRIKRKLKIKEKLCWGDNNEKIF